jgi:hypothetical protein
MKNSKKPSKTTSRRPKPNRRPTRKASSAREEKPQPPGGELDRLAGPPSVRFSATIHPRGKTDAKLIEKIDLDRVPDPQGQIRALVTTADLVKLLDQGFEVRLHQAYPVQPLNPKLIESEDSFKRWLDKTVQGIKGAKKP